MNRRFYMVKALEYCSLRQAATWIDKRQQPLPEHIEQMLRGEPEPIISYYNEKPAHPELLELILNGQIKTVGVLGRVTCLRTLVDEFEFTPTDTATVALTDIIENTPLNYADFEHNCIYILPRIEYTNGVPIRCAGLPVPALGNIQVCFADLLRFFPAELGTTNTNAPCIEYRDSTIYTNTDGTLRKLKTLRAGNQRAVFEYLYKNPGRRIADAELAEQASLPNAWTKEDSIAQLMINIFPDTALRKTLFPILTKHEAMFTNGATTH